MRRAFATPLVLTFACGSSKEPEPIHVNPPPPELQRDAGLTGSDEANATFTHNPPAPTPPEPVEKPVARNVNPPPPTQEPEPAQTERSWMLSMRDGKCQVTSNDTCPKVPPGQPIPTCNPPAPVDYACPSGIVNGASDRIVQHAGQTVCVIPPSIGGGNCPPNMHCNPPPPRDVPCPKS